MKLSHPLRGSVMVQGTTSGAGKSTVVVGLCRLLQRRGARVAPFKPQNMALNSAVTEDGGEIGRAQALQAAAAGVAPLADMNPVLLKPTSDRRAQVIIQGRVHGEMDAREYHQFKPQALQAVMASFERLQRRFDFIVVEGAGSPAEVNLREGDIANMGFALEALCPVVLVADIDRGGVLAHITGTLECLSRDEHALVQGILINRFRGDLALLQPGLEWLKTRTGKPVFGVLPMLHGLRLDAEDAIEIEQYRPAGRPLKVCVPVYPRISNHTDFDALRANPQVDLVFAAPGDGIPACDLVILGGSKSVCSDLDFIRQQGWDVQIARHLRYGGKVIGICGGMQMLGTALHDPHGLEGNPGSSQGLGWLALESTLEPEKQLREVRGKLAFGARSDVHGYEIHMGVSSGTALARPALDLGARMDGAISEDGQILATYVHGLFDHAPACGVLLEWAGLHGAKGIDLAAERERNIDRVADVLEEHLDVDRMLGPGLDLSHKMHFLRPLRSPKGVIA